MGWRRSEQVFVFSSLVSSVGYGNITAASYTAFGNMNVKNKTTTTESVTLTRLVRSDKPYLRFTHSDFVSDLFFFFFLAIIDTVIFRGNGFLLKCDCDWHG